MTLNYTNITSKESALFETLKLLLLIQVVVGHAVALSLPKLDEITTKSIVDILLILYKATFSFGRESAYLFVFLSGFFTSNIFFRFHQSFSLPLVLKKRINRIYPFFIIVLLLTFILDWIGIFVFKFEVYRLNPLNYPVNEHLSIELFFTNLLSLQPTFSITFGSNGPLWTLGYLMQFYLLFSLLRFFSKESRSQLVLTTTIIIIVISVFNIEFALLFYIWFLGTIFRSLNFKSIHVNVFLVMLAILLLISISKLSSKYASMALTPLTGFLILHLFKKIPEVILGKNLSGFSQFSDISYCLYAVHMPILFFSYGLFFRLAEDTLIQNLSFAYPILGLVISFLVSALVNNVSNIKLK